MAASQDLNIDQFATFRTSFRWQTKSSGAAVDLTGYTAALQIRTKPEAATALVSLSSPDNGITIDGPAGRVHIEIDSSVTSQLEPGKYVYDLVLTDADYKKRLIEGIVRVDAGVTR